MDRVHRNGSGRRYDINIVAAVVEAYSSSGSGVSTRGRDEDDDAADIV